jgi:hypothetical protein
VLLCAAGAERVLQLLLHLPATIVNALLNGHTGVTSNEELKRTFAEYLSIIVCCTVLPWMKNL